MNLKDETIINEVAKIISSGELQPWKVEEFLFKEYRISPPINYNLAALTRRKVIEDITGHQFKYLEMPDNPYIIKWQCPKDDSIWYLEARDMNTTCTYCGSVLKLLESDKERFMPLAVNYIGGK